MRKEIKGVYRKKIERWYEEFKECLQDSNHPMRQLPSLKGLKFYITDAFGDNLAENHFALTGEKFITFGTALLEFFGNREECVKFVVLHEFVHFITVCHGEVFKDFMVHKLGYEGIYLWDQIGVKKYDGIVGYRKKHSLNKNKWCLR
jgi:hypothetical protein